MIKLSILAHSKYMYTNGAGSSSHCASYHYLRNQARIRSVTSCLSQIHKSLSFQNGVRKAYIRTLPSTEEEPQHRTAVSTNINPIAMGRALQTLSNNHRVVLHINVCIHR